MSLLTECTRGESVMVRRVNATGPLKQRFLSFGIMKGVRVSVLEFSANKSTAEVKVGSMRIALRREEAELIEVDPCGVAS